MWHLKKNLASLAVALAVLLSLAAAALADPINNGYDLSWWTVDGGGGLITDDPSGYALGGTASQPDAAMWRGQGYTLAGGFWGGAPVEYQAYLPLVLRND